MNQALLTLLLFCWSLLAHGYAEADQDRAKLTVENINAAREILRDPTLANASLKAKVGKLAGPTRSAVEDITRATTMERLEPEEPDQSPFKDPTKMSGSFRATMNKMTVRQTTKITSTGSPPPMPEISLAAIVYGSEKEYYAMLHVDENTVLIKEGDKATFVDNNKVIDLVVQQITKNDVRIAVQPSNQQIVLR
jgi:hypothetical protein